MMNERIGIVGAGLIGRAWAIVFARAGCSVRIYDGAPDALAACQALLRENVTDLSQHGLIGEAPDVVLARITPVSTLAEALEGASALDASADRVVQLGLSGERLDEGVGLPGHEPSEVGDGGQPLAPSLRP